MARKKKIEEVAELLPWRDRYVETIQVQAGSINPHPHNPKLHGEPQKKALNGLLEEVGKVDSLKAYRSEKFGGLVFWDGHGRRDLRPDETWRVDVYDLTDAEVDLLLAAYDPIGWMATQSRVEMETVMQGINAENAQLVQFLAKQGKRLGITQDEDETLDEIGQMEYRIIVECKNEREQTRLLKKFEREGLICKALIS
jgi:hypothetical protein